MIETIYNKFIKFVDSNRIAFLIFFSSFFIYTTFSGTRLFFSDEGIILDQFYNLIHGSLALKFAKINTASGILTLVGNNLYGMFSYSLLILSLPVYYLLSLIDMLSLINPVYGAHQFLLQIWAFCGGTVVYLLLKNRNSNYASLSGIVFYIVLISVNIFLFKPIFFPKWGELLSVELTNILISSFLVLVIYVLFRHLFSQKIGIFSALFVLFTTPISFYAITLKHHSLTLLLTLIAFYFFYKYTEKNENKFIYLAYVSAGLCIWTRTLDGAMLLGSLLITDIIVFKRGIKNMMYISMAILISLLPFFLLNYLILGNPISIIDTMPLADKQIPLVPAKYMISLDDTSSKTSQIELLDKLGYIWTGKINGDYSEIVGYTLFLKLVNTFGVFLLSPFLIISIASILNMITGKIKTNAIDKFFLIYILMLFGIYGALYKFFNQNYLMYILTDTPMALDYRYLLIMYVILLYFTFRSQKVNHLIQCNYKKIGLVYGIILIITSVYFIVEFPIPFLNIYNNASRMTLFLLLMLVLWGVIIKGRRSFTSLTDNIMILLIGMALAEASFMLLFYYWAVSITYVSPSQNLLIIPIIQHLISWMYGMIL